MRKREKNSINWLCNQADAFLLLNVIPPREFTVIEAVTLESSDKEELHESYSKMVEHTDAEAYSKLQTWMDKVTKEFKHDPGRRYIYFRFKRLN